MTTDVRLELNGVEQRVCDIASERLGMHRDKVHPASRLIEDLRCDSLDLVELIMEVEDAFLVTIPDEPENPVGKSIFARQPFRLSDLAEIVYLQQGTGRPERRRGHRRIVNDSECSTVPFCQLGGRWPGQASDQRQSLFESFRSENGVNQFRRRSDGMRCVLLPSAAISIGRDGPESQPVEQPAHTVQLDSFLIDVEPVSTTAYCRFLNSVEATETDLAAWFVLDATDNRIAQMPVVYLDNEWRPVAGSETMPMVLVSWFGANAYSLWANGLQPELYNTREGFLPSEAQWEYAALGDFHG